MGEVLGPYGIRGWLKVRSFAESPGALLDYATWWLQPARGAAWSEYRRQDGRLHSGALVVALEGVGTREAALAMKGFAIGVPRVALPAASEGEFYWDDLTGLAVVNRSGLLLGEVRGMTQHGAHPLLRVARPSGSPGAERLIPFVAAIVDRVDVDAGRIEVDWGADY
jgi:16S rRNA processing protein RimM